MPRSVDAISTKGQVVFWRKIGIDRTLRESNEVAGEKQMGLVDNSGPIQSAQESFQEGQDDLAVARGMVICSMLGVLLWFAVVRFVAWFM